MVECNVGIVSVEAEFYDVESVVTREPVTQGSDFVFFAVCQVLEGGGAALEYLHQAARVAPEEVFYVLAPSVVFYEVGVCVVGHGGRIPQERGADKWGCR